MHNHETPWKQNLNIGESGMYRFDPRTFAITPHAANKPNPHGTSFDYWGYCYANDGTGGKSYQVRPEGKGFKMHTLLTKEFRPVAANADSVLGTLSRRHAERLSDLQHDRIPGRQTVLARSRRGREDARIRTRLGNAGP